MSLVKPVAACLAPSKGVVKQTLIIQHPLKLLMIQSDKLAYLTNLSGSRGC